MFWQQHLPCVRHPQHLRFAGDDPDDDSTAFWGPTHGDMARGRPARATGCAASGRPGVAMGTQGQRVDGKSQLQDSAAVRVRVCGVAMAVQKNPLCPPYLSHV